MSGEEEPSLFRRIDHRIKSGEDRARQEYQSNLAASRERSAYIADLTRSGDEDDRSAALALLSDDFVVELAADSQSGGRYVIAGDQLRMYLPWAVAGSAGDAQVVTEARLLGSSLSVPVKFSRSLRMGPFLGSDIDKRRGQLRTEGVEIRFFAGSKCRGVEVDFSALQERRLCEIEAVQQSALLPLERPRASLVAAHLGFWAVATAFGCTLTYFAFPTSAAIFTKFIGDFQGADIAKYAPPPPWGKGMTNDLAAPWNTVRDWLAGTCVLATFLVFTIQGARGFLAGTFPVLIAPYLGIERDITRSRLAGKEVWRKRATS